MDPKPALSSPVRTVTKLLIAVSRWNTRGGMLVRAPTETEHPPRWEMAAVAVRFCRR